MTGSGGGFAAERRPASTIVGTLPPERRTGPMPAARKPARSPARKPDLEGPAR
ncbi:hypothetical protein ABH926_001481 [Catenulispora sp. GP43]|uniref:hypothetical protein n=1 Tax=Catenulispora sp. GP43 TaxID=3156263 RepID=UPI0035173EC9